MRNPIKRKKRAIITAPADAHPCGAVAIDLFSDVAALWNRARIGSCIRSPLAPAPLTIGVAPGSWSQNGWLQQCNPFTNARQTWYVACRMHDTGRSFSPDIADMKVGRKPGVGAVG